ncbi:MAG TPA: hypothetical protein VMX55_15350 [candidate division Zixibacteria bacterium]|nr:hypothetical protein [candidate division Zixibacteria bacterium]
MSSPINIQEIKNEILSILNEIKNNTNWEIYRELKDIKIEIGKAPEFYESFGVIRSKDKLIFGDWINSVKPDNLMNNLWIFILIREGFSFFFDDSCLFGPLAQLTNFILNLLALSFMNLKEPGIGRDVKFFPIQGRFLLPPKKSSSETKILFLKISSLVDIVNQGISYNLIFRTYNSFIDDISDEEIDFSETINDMKEYLSSEYDEIASPLKLKENTLSVLLKLLEIGYDSSTLQIANELNINQSTVARQLAKLAIKYSAKWRLEKNHFKLRLHTYLLLIRINLKSQNISESVVREISQNEYISQYFEGRGNDFYYHYSVFQCPHLIAEKTRRKLEIMQENGIITSFIIKEVKNRIFRTTIIDYKFQPSFENFKKLISGKINVNKIVLWDYNYFKDRNKEIFDLKDKNLFKFISLIISRKLTKFGLFGVHIIPFQRFLDENNLDQKNMPECLSFVNRIQNIAMERNIIDYRLHLSLAGVRNSNMLIIRIESNSKIKEIENLLEEISIFSRILINTTYDEIYFTILGPDYNHYISDLLTEILMKYKLKFEIFSVKTKYFRNVEYDKLFDFDSNKWLLK